MVGAPEGEYIWSQLGGPTVFAPFENDSDYFAADKPFMLNLRVDDLAARFVAAFRSVNPGH